MSGSSRTPNILVVIIDAVRRDHCSLYGYERATTPNLDRIAETGTVFEHAIADSGWTPASVASILTGVCAGEHGVDLDHPLPGGLPSVAELVAARGYHTAAFSANPLASPLFGHGRGFERFWYWERWSAKSRLRSVPRYIGRKLGLADMGGAQMLRHALGHLRACPRPFFAYLHFNDVHTPYAALWPYSRRFLRCPASRAELVRLSRRSRHIYDFSATATDKEIELAQDVYDGSILYQDHLLGRLCDRLAYVAGPDNTLVMVLADHGEAFGEEGTIGHTFGLDEAMIRIPLVIVGPEVPAGERLDTLVQTRDIAETVCAAAGSNGLREAALDRIDLRDARHADRPYAYSLRTVMGPEKVAGHRQKEPSFDFDRFNRHTTCIRSTEHKLTRTEGRGTRLQDLLSDGPAGPDRSEDYPELAADLEQRLGQWERAQRSLQDEDHAEMPTHDPVVEERLRTLGYIP